MKGFMGIEALGASFTAGVALGAVSGVNVWRDSIFSAVLCGGIQLIVTLLAVLLSGRYLQFVISYYLLFILIGFFCSCNCQYIEQQPLFGNLLEKFTSMIGNIPFSSPDTGPLVTALLSGDRSLIPREVKECFRLSGASHILALSGLHLGVIYVIIARALTPLGNSRAASILRSALISLFCLFYTLLTGANPSTVRALLFIELRETMMHFPMREVSNMRIFSAALFIQLFFKPSVITSVGFQLSYLAMLGIFIVFPRLSAWYPDIGNALSDKWKPSKWIWNSAALSLSCQLFTAPLVLMKFGTFPTYFILTNLLLLPLAELLIISAVACTAMQMLLPGGCPELPARLADFLTNGLIFVLKVISSM